MRVRLLKPFKAILSTEIEKEKHNSGKYQRKKAFS